MASTRRWKVGELAQATGLTVRTLHYWDEVGLVSPQRTASGHRVYTAAEVARLYQVMALRQMGLGLDEVAALFAGEAPPLRVTLRRHLEAVRRELRQREDLRERLSRVLDVLEHKDADVGVNLLLEVIETMTMFDDQLTSDQRAWFAQRREAVGAERWQQALAAWPQLITQVRAAMDAGADPGIPQVRQLVRQWDELAGLFLGDDPDLKIATGKAWQAMWAGQGDQLRQSPRVATPEMWDYIQRARQAV